jgi:hypothetical protein
MQDVVRSGTIAAANAAISYGLARSGLAQYAIHGYSEAPDIDDPMDESPPLPTHRKPSLSEMPVYKKRRYNPKGKRTVRRKTVRRGKAKRVARKPRKSVKKRTVRKTYGKKAGGFKVSQVNTRGYHVEYEYSNTVGGAAGAEDIVAVGHGTPIATLLLTVCGAVMRTLMKKSGRDISAWRDIAKETTGTARVRFCVYTRQNYAFTLAPTQTNIDIAASQSYKTMAIAIRDSLLDLYVDTTDSCIWDRIELYISSDSGVTYSMEGSLQCSNIKLNLMVTSTLVCQNQSRGANGAAAGSDSNENVEANPLTGRFWEVPGNFIRTKMTSATTTDQQSVIANPQYGTYYGAGTAAGLLNRQKVCGPRDAAMVRKTARLSCAPGAFIKSKHSMTKVVMLSKFMRLTRPFWKRATSANKDSTFIDVMFGKFRLLQFEKLVHSDEGSNYIQIGFEHNVNIGCYCTYNSANYLKKDTDVTNS